MVTVSAPNKLRAHEVEAWLDTGFTGELVLSDELIADLNLIQSGTISAELGDGSEVVLNVYSCVVEWFGAERQIEVVANTGSFPLLGVGLLENHVLTVDYRSKTVCVD